MFFALQGSRHVGLDLQNKNAANPTAMLLSSVMMLRHLNLDEYANRISTAVYDTIESNAVSDKKKVFYFYFETNRTKKKLIFFLLTFPGG